MINIITVGTGQTECICIMTGQYLTFGIVKIMCKPMITFPGFLNQEIYLHVNTILTILDCNLSSKQI